MEAEAESAVEAEGDRKRREADPQLLVPGVLPYAAPVVPLLKHVCKEETQEYCYPETKVVEDTITTKKCLVRDDNIETFRAMIHHILFAWILTRSVLNLLIISSPIPIRIALRPFCPSHQQLCNVICSVEDQRGVPGRGAQDPQGGV